ncbi:MAG: polyketide cyclase [Lacunisphaera sp.]|nr:polyketide cyclase [Lacunisphaera sp.]
MRSTTAMKTITASRPASLPAAVTRYLEAANRFDAVVAADCFTADASVHDENHDYVGRDAIRAWVAHTSGKYRPAFCVLRATMSGDAVSLSVAVSGQFPGSPVTLDYQLRLRDGKIFTLTIE